MHDKIEVKMQFYEKYQPLKIYVYIIAWDTNLIISTHVGEGSVICHLWYHLEFDFKIFYTVTVRANHNITWQLQNISAMHFNAMQAKIYRLSEYKSIRLSFLHIPVVVDGVKYRASSLPINAIPELLLLTAGLLFLCREWLVFDFLYTKKGSLILLQKK